MAYAQFQLVQFIKVEGRKLLLKATEIKASLSHWPYCDKGSRQRREREFQVENG